MAEEVKIVDVAGGPAAEATLQEILKIMKQRGGSGGGSGGTAAASKAQDLYTTAVTRGTKVRKENTSAVKNATDATNTFASRLSSVGGLIGGALGGLVGITKNFATAMTEATTIGGVLEAIPIFGSILGQATGYFQDSVNTFRQLSDVGAGFGNDMMAMRKAAADSGLTLDQFASVIGNNSARMNLLGATTSDGAARFGRLSKALRTQEAGLLSLGFTQEEVNEGLADYMQNQALMGRMRNRSDQSLIAGANAYMKELDMLARMTGKSRKQIQDEMNSRAQAANVNVMLANMDPSNVDAFQRNLQFASDIMGDSGPAFSEALADLADGTAQTPLAQYLEANVTGLKDLQEQNRLGLITEEQYRQGMQDLMPQITGLFDGMGAARVSAILARDGLGDLANMTADARLAAQRGRDMQDALTASQAAEAEALRRAPLTQTFANFEQTIQNVKSSFENALLDSGILETVGGLLGDLGTGITELAQDGVNWFAEYLKSDSFQSALVNFKDFVADAAETVKKFITDIGDVGFAQALKNAFGMKEGEGFGSMIGGWITDGILGMLPDWDTLAVGLLAGIGTVLLAPFLGAFGAIGVAIVAMFGWENIKQWAEDAWNGITGMFSGIGEWWDSLDFSQMLDDTWNTVKGWFGFGDTSFSISQIANDAWETVKGWFTFGEDSNFSISQIATDAWNTVTGWFSFGETNFSISEIANDMWNTVTGWFSFGEGESSFSVSQIASDMWNTVTGWFTFGEGESGFSLSGLASSAWETVTSWFSFEGVEMPSIKDMFNNIKEKVLGFFDFDFELPDFTDYLPTWLGGEGKSLFGGDEPGTTATASVSNPEQSMPTIEQPANVTAMGGLNFASQVEGARALQAVLADIGAMQSFNTELERIQSGLDSSAVDRYNTSMQRLVETLEDLNEVLAEDNEGMLGGGTGVSAASLISSGQLGGGSGTGSEEQLNRLNMLVSQLVSLQEENVRYTRGTMRAVNGNLQLGV